MIYNLPIEPIEARYSIQWDIWFKEAFGESAITIYGDESHGKIKVGSFLDVYETNRYKCTQMANLIEAVAGNVVDEDIFFFHDLWNQNVLNLKYVLDGIGSKAKICGCLHAGTYDPHDFLTQSNMAKWGKHLEEALFRAIDLVFVATDFHSNLIRWNRNLERQKICVTGFPIKFKPLIVPKENIVVFPHRMNPEKNPDLFNVKKLGNKYPNWKFVYSIRETKTKEEYYNLLAKSKIAVSFADQETWGIAMQEAVLSHCVPLVPDRLSYSEMYYKKHKYTSMDDFYEKLYILINSSWDNIDDHLEYKFINSGRQAIPRMIREMEEL